MPDMDIEIHCPHCDAAMVVKLSQIAREEIVDCSCCHKKIEMKPDPPPALEELERISESFQKINQAARKKQGRPENQKNV